MINSTSITDSSPSMEEHSSIFPTMTQPISSILSHPFIILFISNLFVTIYTAIELCRVRKRLHASRAGGPLLHTQQSGELGLLQTNGNGGSGSGGGHGSDIESPADTMMAGGVHRGDRGSGGGGGGGHRMTRLSRTAVANTHDRMNITRDDSPIGVRDLDGQNLPYSGGEENGISHGEATRVSFYEWVFIALLSRLFMLPIQAYNYLPSKKDGSYPYINTSTGMCLPHAQGCVVSRTLPDLTFATAFAILVLFYAETTYTATGPSPQSHRLNFFCNGGWATTLNMSVVNKILYFFYFGLLFFTQTIPLIPVSLFQYGVWYFLCVVYAICFIFMSIFGYRLTTLLKASLQRVRGLAVRLIGLAILCCFVFFGNSLFFAEEVLDIRNEEHIGMFQKPIFGKRLWRKDSIWDSYLGRDLLQDLVFELIPVFIILCMIHPKKKEGLSSSSSSSPPVLGATGTATSTIAGTNPAMMTSNTPIMHNTTNAPSPASQSSAIPVTNTEMRRSHSANVGFPAIAKSSQQQQSRGFSPNVSSQTQQQGLTRPQSSSVAGASLMETTSLLDRNPGSTYGSNTLSSSVTATGSNLMD